MSDAPNVIALPGVERRDLGGETPADRVLTAALDAGLLDVVVVGRDRCGEFYLAASDGNADAVVGKLFRAAQWLSERELVP
jgi:hypothetical protein